MLHRTGCFRSIGAAALFLLATLLPVPAGAAAISIEPGGDGLYALQGAGFDGVSAMELTVRYDASLLSGPQVILGPLITGAMTAVNATVPGSIRIVLVSISPIRGSGLIATLIFTQHSSGGRITALDARMADLRGSPLPAVVQIIEPEPQQASPPAAAAGQPSSGEGTATPSSGPVFPSPLTAGLQTGSGNTQHRPAQEDGAGLENAPEESSDAPPILAKREPAVASGDKTETPVLPFYRPTGVLDSFLEHPGERTPESLLGLFRNESTIGWHQDPPVLLSDGRTTATVTFLAPPGLDASSNIAVMGATLRSLTRDRENSNQWIATLLPEEGALRASLAVRLGNRLIVYPLTVAPPVSAAPGRPALGTENGLRAYLAGRPTDLNGDGRADRVDDFIAAANFLATRGTAKPVRPDRPANSKAQR